MSLDPVPPPSHPSPSPKPRRWPGVLFGLCAVWALILPVLTRDAAASNSDLDQMAAALATLPPNTFVLIHPPWRWDVVAGLEARGLHSAHGPALPQDVMAGRRPLVVVKWPHAPSPAALWGKPVDETRAVGEATLDYYFGANQAGPLHSPQANASQLTQAAWDLPTALPHAVVTLSGGTQVACNAWEGLPAPRWMCPGMNEWNYVGLRQIPVDGQNRLCLWAHPMTGATLSITFPAVPLGRALRLGHALADGAAAAPNGQPVEVTMTAGAARLQVKHSNEPGWKEDLLSTPQAGAPVEVKLEITTPHDGARHFCVWLAVDP